MSYFMKGMGAIACCFLFIYWMPINSLPLNTEVFIYTIMNPLAFLVGAAFLMIGTVLQGKMVHDIVRLVKRKRFGTGLFVCVAAALPASLIIISYEMVLIFYVLAMIYGIISLPSTSKEFEKG
ncbi:hypothetical protein [Thalassobacillus hwangdonensis]|uniref:Uncharacterized protein n=1 Tax=Thalassobacillus hwangdonensis TaxID=546108 RepID=A0ABW3L1N0_9BACI